MLRLYDPEPLYDLGEQVLRVGVGEAFAKSAAVDPARPIDGAQLIEEHRARRVVGGRCHIALLHAGKYC